MDDQARAVPCMECRTPVLPEDGAPVWLDPESPTPQAALCLACYMRVVLGRPLVPEAGERDPS